MDILGTPVFSIILKTEFFSRRAKFGSVFKSSYINDGCIDMDLRFKFI